MTTLQQRLANRLAMWEHVNNHPASTPEQRRAARIEIDHIHRLIADVRYQDAL